MKFKLTVASLALLMANSAWAEAQPSYYTVEEISVAAEGALFGPYPVAMSIDDTGNQFIATYSMKASLSNDIDIGLPFTFNRECQYDYIICELEFDGSDTSGHFSYENAYKAWRNAQSDAATGYESYMMGNTLTGDSDSVTDDGQVIPFDAGGNTTDVKVTDVYIKDNGERFIVGYSSAPYVAGQRDFVRRAFIQSLDGTLVSLLPQAFSGDNGGFSSAYKIETTTDGNIIVIGAASVSYPRNNTDYFEDCYFSEEYDDRYDVNELVRCPGFDTQAWSWDVTDIISGEFTETELEGTALATEWLDDNTDNRNKSLTYSANAFDINASGIAVGTSTFERSNNSEGARQRAITMTPTAGVYGVPRELKEATNDIDDQDDWIYNTWAVTISDAGLVTGNREYEAAKGRNKATEFFVFVNESKKILFPLLDKKVTTTKLRLESNSYYESKSGANSRAYDANEDGMVVGSIDDFDQVSPVYQGSPRSPSAFLYDNTNNQAWYMNDLICNQDMDGVITSPNIRLIAARVITAEGVVLADGYEYPSADDYKYKTNGVQKAFRLTPNVAVLSPNESPNCWESDLLKTNDESYERQGGATFWLWLFALPLVFIRRFKR